MPGTDWSCHAPHVALIVPAGAKAVPARAAAGKPQAQNSGVPFQSDLPSSRARLGWLARRNLPAIIALDVIVRGHALDAQAQKHTHRVARLIDAGSIAVHHPRSPLTGFSASATLAAATGALLCAAPARARDHLAAYALPMAFRINC